MVTSFELLQPFLFQTPALLRHVKAVAERRELEGQPRLISFPSPASLRT